MVSRERGLVTAETMMVAPFVVAVAVAGIWLVSLGVTHARATDAAREAARSLARGDSQEVAERHATDAAARGSRIEISRQHDAVEVTVSTPARLPLFGGVGTTVSGRAVASLE